MASSLVRDFRYALRSIQRRPVPHLASIAVLAVAIGGTAAIGTLVDALLFRALPVNRPDELISIRSVQADGKDAPVSAAALEQLRNVHGIERVAEYTGGLLLTSEHNNALRVAAVDAVGTDYFQILGVRPVVGDLFASIADAAGRNAVISFAYWHREFGESTSALGSIVSIEGTSFRIIGVTPKSFKGVNVGESFDIAIPIGSLFVVLTGQARDALDASAARAIARRVRGADLREIQSELSARWPEVLRHALPPELTGARRDGFLARHVLVEPLRTGVSFLRPRYSATAVMFLDLSLMLLVVIGLGLSSIWLSRIRSRHGELLILLAIGAGLGDLVRLALCEIILLCVAGGVLAYPIAAAGDHAIESLIRHAVGGPVSIAVVEGARLLMVVVVSSASVFIVAAAAPAVGVAALGHQARFGSIVPQLRRRTRLQNVLMTTEVAVTVIMLLLAFRSVQAVLNAGRGSPGFEVSGRSVAQLLPRPKFVSSLRTGPYFRQLASRISALPGVTSVAFSFAVPGRANTASKTEVGIPGTAVARTTSVVISSPEYLSTLGIPLISGRECSWADDQSRTPVAVISASLADALRGNTDVLGERIRIADRAFQIIGISANARLRDIRSTDTDVALTCGLQSRGGLTGSTVVIATKGSVRVSEEALSGVVSRLGQDYITEYRTLSEDLADLTRPDRVGAASVILYTVTASLLLVIALYVTLLQIIEEREAEFAVRMALGASVRDVQWLAFRTVALVLPVGVALGLAALPFATRVVPPPDFGATRPDVTAVTLCIFITTGLVCAGVYQPAQLLRRLAMPRALRAL